MSQEFKDGDKVRILRAFTKADTSVWWNPQMDNTIGKIGKIRFRYDSSDDYYVDIGDPRQCSWTYIAAVLQIVGEDEEDTCTEPAAKVADDHAGQTYNPVTGKWSWF